MQFDDIVREVGGFGRYQKSLVLLVMFPQILISIQALLPVFVLSTHDHWCEKGVDEESIQDKAGISYSLQGTNDVIPNVTLYPSQCSMDMFFNSTNNTDKEACTAWSYDKRELTSTPISDFDLVCDEAILKLHAKMAFMGGNLFGSLVLGFLGDTYGRKIVMYFGAVLLFGSSLACAWSVNITMYVVLRFLAGTGTISCIGSAMIIAFEMVDPAHRSHAVVAVELAWGIGEVVLSGAAYFLRDWRHLQIAVSCPGVLLLFYWLLMPESPRWLLSKGKGEEAMAIVRTAARVNKRHAPADMAGMELEQHNISNEIMPVFKSCRLLFRFIVVVFLWLILAMSYYGLTFNVSRIGDNIYLEFLIYAVLEMIAFISCLYINTRFGRKTLNIGAFLLAGVACVASTLVSLYVDEDRRWLAIALSAIGRMCVSAVFANIFVYSGELFPTTIRSFILASSNVGARLGAVSAPYITDLGTAFGIEFGNTSLIFGVLSVVAGILSCFLPETLNIALPDDMDDMADQLAHVKQRPFRRELDSSQSDPAL